MEAEAVVEAAETVARRWNEESVRYVVMHGLEGHPNRLGRDLDMLMRPSDAASALPQAAGILGDLGWRTLVCPPRLWGRRLVALRGDEDAPLYYLELHTIRSLRWAALRLVDHDERPTGLVGPFPVSAWATFAKTVLTPLLSGDTGRFDRRYLDGLASVGVTRDPVVERTTALFGAVLGGEVVDAALAGDARALRLLAPALRRAAVQQMTRRPHQAARVVPGLIRQKAGRLVSRTGITVRIRMQPPQLDFVTALERELRAVFPKVTVTRDTSASARLRQQYATLSRQGVLLLLDETTQPPEGGIELTVDGMGSVEGEVRRVALSSGPDTDLAAKRSARWVIAHWARRFSCTSPNAGTAVATPPVSAGESR